MGIEKRKIDDRYFVETNSEVLQMFQIIKKDKENSIFQVIVKNSAEIKRLTWFLVKEDINFIKKSVGSGIAHFFVDKTVPYFIKRK